VSPRISPAPSVTSYSSSYCTCSNLTYTRYDDITLDLAHALILHMLMHSHIPHGVAHAHSVASCSVASRSVASRSVASRSVASRSVASRSVASRSVASRSVASCIIHHVSHRAAYSTHARHAHTRARPPALSLALFQTWERREGAKRTPRAFVTPLHACSPF